MAKSRPVQVPGEVAASPAEVVSAVGGDDLAAFDGEKLPEGSPVLTLTQAQLDAQIQAAVARAVRRHLPEQPAAASAGPEVVSVAEAAAQQAAMVKQGLRPRMILTPEGWYTHREMARVAEHGKE